MSQENVELVIDNGFEQETAAGVGEMRKLWRQQITLWDTWATGPIERLIEDGEHVVVGHKLLGRSKRGLSIAMENAGAAFTFRAGRIVRMFVSHQVANALEAVGLSE